MTGLRDFLAALSAEPDRLDEADAAALVAPADADGGYLVPAYLTGAMLFELADRRRASRGWRRHCRALKAAGRWTGREVSRYLLNGTVLDGRIYEAWR